MIRHRLLQAAGLALCAGSIVAGTAFVSRSSETPDPQATPAQYAPSAVATAAPLVYGDLMHLVFTATQNLHGSFVDPVDGQAISLSAAQVTVQTINGAGVELKLNDDIVSYKRLGKRVVNSKTGQTQYVFYGLNLQPGPNVLEATVLGANGLRGDTMRETIFGPGHPTSVHVQMKGALVADGKTPAYLQVSVLDEWGHPALPGAKLRVNLNGNAHFMQTEQPVAQSDAPTPQGSAAPPPQPADGQRYEAPLGDGAFVSVPVVPGVVAGPLEVDVDANGITDREHYYIDPYLRKPIVAGLVSVGAGSVPGQVDGEGTDDGGNARKERVAVFGTGQAGKNTLVTAAYESQNRLTPLSSIGPFVDDPHERPYLTYGDSSRVVSDLKSNDRVFARIDRGRNSAMWGQFDATTTDADVGAYHQLLSGAKVELAGKNDRAHLTAFTAHNDVAYVSQTLPVSGLSGLLQTLRPDIVVASEYVQLVSLDRQTGAVVSSRTLVRNIDYTIDYATGVLRFIEVPLPFDDKFNPQVILLQYQYQGAATDSRTTGGALRFTFGRDGGTTGQFGYVNDVTGGGNYTLYSEQIRRKWSGGEWALSRASNRGAYPNASANGSIAGNGDALAFRLHAHGGFNDVDLTFADTSPSFYNPFGGISTPGLLNYHAAFTHVLPRRSSMTVSFDGQANHGVGNDDTQQNATVMFSDAISQKLSLLLGFVEHRQKAAVVAAAANGSAAPFASMTTSQAQAGLQYHPNKKMAISVTQIATLSGSDFGSTQPSQTAVQFDYDLGNRGKFYARELMSSQPVSTFATATAPLTAGSGFTRSLQFGVQRPLTPAMTVSSDYVINHTGDATDVYTALGVQEKLRLSKYVAGNVFYQNANDAGPSATGFHVMGADLAYSKPNAARLSFSYQTRTGPNGGTTFAGGAGGRLSPNVSVMGSFQRAFGNGQTGIDERLSLAYRPQDDDRLISLFGYQRTNALASLFGGASISDVMSFEELWRPTASTEIASRFAYKLSGDDFYVAHTSMAAVRIRQNLGARFDIGGEARGFAIPSASGARSTDFAVEAGYQLGNSARVAAGYNFSGSVDPTLTGHPQRKGFYVQITTLVDRIFGWGKQ